MKKDIRKQYGNKLSKERLDRLTFDLKYSNYTYEELGELYGILSNEVKDIDAGISWDRDYIIYPIRKTCFVGNELLYSQIQNDLLSTNLSFGKISLKYKCSEDTINSLNTGEIFFRNELKYPLRRYGNLSSEDVLKIHELLLEDKKSINEIAAQYNVSDASIKRINSGKTKKYRDDRFTYPLRK